MSTSDYILKTVAWNISSKDCIVGTMYYPSPLNTRTKVAKVRCTLSSHRRKREYADLPSLINHLESDHGVKSDTWELTAAHWTVTNRNGPPVLGVVYPMSRILPSSNLFYASCEACNLNNQTYSEGGLFKIKEDAFKDFVDHLKAKHNS